MMLYDGWNVGKNKRVWCLKRDLFHRFFFRNVSSLSFSSSTKDEPKQFLKILICFRAALFESNIKCRYNCVNFDKSRRKYIHFSRLALCRLPLFFLYAFVYQLFIFYFERLYVFERRNKTFSSILCFLFPAFICVVDDDYVFHRVVFVTYASSLEIVSK